MILLFFPSPPTVSTFQCWAVTATATDSFVGVNNLLNTWAYWSTYTWAQLEASNRTWEYLAGNWFATASTGTGTWSTVIEGSCPRI